MKAQYCNSKSLVVVFFLFTQHWLLKLFNASLKYINNICLKRSSHFAYSCLIIYYFGLLFVFSFFPVKDAACATAHLSTQLLKVLSRFKLWLTLSLSANGSSYFNGISWAFISSVFKENILLVSDPFKPFHNLHFGKPWELISYAKHQHSRMSVPPDPPWGGGMKKSHRSRHTGRSGCCLSAPSLFTFICF